MIDNKKIKEAARQHMIKEYCNNGDWSFPCKTADIKSQCEDDFKSGACWAMQEFLKDLWHGIKEGPKKGKWIVTRYLNDDNDYVYEVDINTSTTPWKEYARKYRITQWLYIDGLLPKDRD